MNTSEQNLLSRQKVEAPVHVLDNHTAAKREGEHQAYFAKISAVQNHQQLQKYSGSFISCNNTYHSPPLPYM